jgi:hypothetical protein
MDELKNLIMKNDRSVTGFNVVNMESCPHPSKYIKLAKFGTVRLPKYSLRV